MDQGDLLKAVRWDSSTSVKVLEVVAYKPHLDMLQHADYAV
jgi:hypothetical protein